MRINLNNPALFLSALLQLACSTPGAPRLEFQVGSQEPVQASESRVERRLAMMGTQLRLEVQAGSRAESLAASELAVRALQEAEQRLSTWREDSELSRLNRAPAGQRFPLSPLLAAELQRVQELWRATDGAFDPGIGSVLQAWGLRSGGKQPSSEELREARSSAGFGFLELEPTHALRQHAGLVIEEGGFGKGAGLDRALEALAQSAAQTAFLDLGGQVALFGAQSVRLGLADPSDRERPLLGLTLDSGSLATSGNSERGLEVAGESYSHLIDPRSGSPAADFGSLTVWAPDATSADALSTGLYVMGPAAALRWALEHDSIEIIVLIKDAAGPKAIATPGWQGRLESLEAGLRLEILNPHSLESRSR